MKRKEISTEISMSYTGPIDHGNTIQPQRPLSAETARVIALGCWRAPGRIHQLDHFRKRSKERGYSILDVQFAIKYGTIVFGPIFCPEPHNNFKYCFRARVDGIGFKVVFALNPTQDYEVSPLLLLITAVWQTKNGKRY